MIQVVRPFVGPFVHPSVRHVIEIQNFENTNWIFGRWNVYGLEVCSFNFDKKRS
jgi:hypothetical protein